MTAPKGDTASFPGFPTSDDSAAVQSAQGAYAQYAAGPGQGVSHQALGGGATNWNAAGPSQGVSHQALGGGPTNWNAAAVPVQTVNRQAPSGSPTGLSVASVSGPNQASRLLPPGVSFPQPQPYVGGQLENYMANFEHGDSQRQTEEMRSVRPPPQQLPGLPAEEYKGGDLHMYSSMFEHGDHARETEEMGEPPYRPYFRAAQGAGAVGPVAVGRVPVAPVPEAPAGLSIIYPPAPIGLDPRTYYLFITGQLPPGTFSHASAAHEAGGSHYGEAHYQRVGPQPRPMGSQGVSSDMGMQQSGSRKGY